MKMVLCCFLVLYVSSHVSAHVRHTGALPLTPEERMADFTARCRMPEVVLCLGFDVSPHVVPQEQYPILHIDTEQHTSGSGSLRLDIQEHIGGALQVHLEKPIEEQSNLYIQWRQRFDPLIETAQTLSLLGVQGLEDSTIPYYAPGVWATLMYHIQIGTWGEPESSVEIWVGDNETPWQQWLHAEHVVLTTERHESRGMVILEFRNSILGEDGAHQKASTWYDEIIVSTQSIGQPAFDPVGVVHVSGRHMP